MIRTFTSHFHPQCILSRNTSRLGRRARRDAADRVHPPLAGRRLAARAVRHRRRLRRAAAQSPPAAGHDRSRDLRPAFRRRGAAARRRRKAAEAQPQRPRRHGRPADRRGHRPRPRSARPHCAGWSSSTAGSPPRRGASACPSSAATWRRATVFSARFSRCSARRPARGSCCAPARGPATGSTSPARSAAAGSATTGGSRPGWPRAHGWRGAARCAR